MLGLKRLDFGSKALGMLVSQIYMYTNELADLHE
jgi:hypothetical protein